MLERTRRLWDTQHRLVGDRRGLFIAIADAVEAENVLYAGSYVDLTPSFVWPAVTYIDVDRRARQFFGDTVGIQLLLAEHGAEPASHAVRFIHDDYTNDLDLDRDSFDLLISLYAGFISEACTRYLRPGGFLLVNPSHGDAAMASIDARYQLRGVVVSDPDGYSVETDDLDAHLIPARDVEITIDLLHETGRGVIYTKAAFAYIFQRVE